jgi:hypothetical protein
MDVRRSEIESVEPGNLLFLAGMLPISDRSIE